MKTDQPKIVVLGAHTSAYVMRCDKLPTPGEYIVGNGFAKSMDGAKGSNQAIAAARLGARAALISAVGDDEEGAAAIQYLASCGVDTAMVSVVPGLPTGMGIAFIDSDGIPIGITNPGAAALIDAAALTKADACFGQYETILISLEIPLETACLAAEKAKEAGMRVILNPSPANALAESPGLAGRLFGKVDVITPNEPEAKLLSGLRPDAEAEAGELLELLFDKTGIGTLIITMGEKGAACLKNGEVFFVGAPKVKAADTSGAGDCFNAAYAVFSAGGVNSRAAVELAVKAASISVTREEVWPSYPTYEEVCGQGRGGENAAV